jgi:hypothetical protein
MATACMIGLFARKPENHPSLLLEKKGIGNLPNNFLLNDKIELFTAFYLPLLLPDHC